MRLSKKTYVKNWEHMKPEEKVQVKLSGNEKKIKGINIDKITNIEEEVMYWRKANAIHKWFVDNIQDGNDDCNEYIVPKSLLTQRLYTVVRDVLKNREMAETILPTTGGFFFGSTNYDYYYFNDLEYTKSVLEKIMQDKDCLYYYYQSSW